MAGLRKTAILIPTKDQVFPTPSAEDIFIKQGIEQKRRFGKSFLKQRSLTSFGCLKAKRD